MPRLLQEALWFGPAGQEDRPDSEREGREVVQVDVLQLWRGWLVG